ncbi:MAG: anion transporter [Calditrichaceae bacterium]|nr:anion transporter [Calditrichaceae bacterium]
MSISDWLNIIVIVVTIIGIAVGRFPVFRMNRATIALVGSAILLLLQAITPEEAYNSIDMNTIVLLFSMMIINANLRLSGFFKLLVNHIIAFSKTPVQLLIFICFSSGILSGLFLNDTIVIIYTPLVLEVVLTLKRNPLPYLIALVTSANVGSAATIVGNPQNMIIGVYSKISFTQFLFYLAPAAVGGLFIIILVIMLIYRHEFRRETFLPVLPEEYRIFKPLMYKSLIVTALMLASFLAGAPVAMASLIAAAVLLFTRRIKPERVFTEIDWSLLVFFCGLFIVTDVLGRYIVGSEFYIIADDYSIKSIVNFSVISIVLSNLISNVPAVLALSPMIKTMANPEIYWILLALTSTFAGNLTLLGSVANLITAELAKKRGVIIRFGEYLKAGIPITLLTVIYGVYLIYIFFV